MTEEHKKLGRRGRKITEVDEPAGGFTHLLLTNRQGQIILQVRKLKYESSMQLGGFQQLSITNGSLWLYWVGLNVCLGLEKMNKRLGQLNYIKINATSRYVFIIGSWCCVGYARKATIKCMSSFENIKYCKGIRPRVQKISLISLTGRDFQNVGNVF